MTTNKPTATAIIKFFPNKHIEVELDGLKNVHPRALDIASNLLRKEFVQKRALFNAEEHKKARARKKQQETKESKAEAKHHREEDKRLQEAADAKLAASEKVNATLAERKQENIENQPGTVTEESEKVTPTENTVQNEESPAKDEKAETSKDETK